MAQPLDLPLPEITTENFTRAWIRFELVAKAKECDAPKQLTVLPTLLRGKLLDHFVDCDDDTKSDLKKLHAALIAASCCWMIPSLQQNHSLLATNGQMRKLRTSHQR